jgi:hypothetical protein
VAPVISTLDWTRPHEQTATAVAIARRLRAMSTDTHSYGPSGHPSPLGSETRATSRSGGT